MRLLAAAAKTLDSSWEAETPVNSSYRFFFVFRFFFLIFVFFITLYVYVHISFDILLERFSRTFSAKRNNVSRSYPRLSVFLFSFRTGVIIVSLVTILGVSAKTFGIEGKSFSERLLLS